MIEKTRAWFKRMIVFPCIILFTSFQNLHAALVKKLKDKFPDKNKNIFLKPNIWLVQLKEGWLVSSVKTYLNWWFQTPGHDGKLVQSYKLFCSSTTLLRTMVILMVILCSNLSLSVLNSKLLCHNLPVIACHCSRRRIAKNDSFSLLIYKCTWN